MFKKGSGWLSLVSFITFLINLFAFLGWMDWIFAKIHKPEAMTVWFSFSTFWFVMAYENS